jgi:hypothetical protein
MGFVPQPNLRYSADTQIIAIITPNEEIPPGNSGNIQLPNQLSKQITDWRAWPQWRVSVNYLEGITGYNFFSNLPDEIEEVIEDDDSSSLILPLYSAALFAVPETTFSSSDSSISSGIVTGINTSIWQNSFVGVSPSRKVAVENSSLEVSSNQGSFNNSTIFEIRPSEVTFVQGSQEKIGSFQVGSSKDDVVQTGAIKFGSSQNSTFQIDALKINLHQVNSTQINSTEISLPSSITLQQLFSSHNFSLQNTTVPTWLEFLQGTTPFNLNIEITDLPTGQLAEATITGFDPTGRPNSGTLYLDTDANGLGWYIDPTPWDNTEYSQTLTDTAYRATADSLAYGHYDLLTTLLHETAHLQGIISGYSNYDRHIQTINGSKTFIGDGFSAILN